MKKILAIFILSLILGQSIIVLPVKADSAPVQIYSGGVVTHDPQGISIVREDLKISIYDQENCRTYPNSYTYCLGDYEVEAIFLFNNPNELKEIETFFPIPAINSEEDLTSLVTMVFNGENITNLEKKEFTFATPTLLSSRSNFSVFAKLNFQQGSNTLTVKYRQTLNPSLYRKSYYRNLQYILTSGGLWDGPIQQLNIEIDFGSVTSLQRYRLLSEQYYFEQKTENVIIYRGFNIDPHQELNIDFIPSDIWDLIYPFLHGAEHKLSYEARNNIYNKLAASLKYAKSGSPLPIINMDNDIIFDIFRSNTFVLVEDGYAEPEGKKWYATYWLSQIGIYTESKATRCPGAYSYSYNLLFESLKQTVIYKLTHYLDNAEFKAEIEQAQAATNPCLIENNPNPLQKETVGPSPESQKNLIDLNELLIVVIFICLFSLFLNLLSFAKKSRRNYIS